jgi:uncharacterized protein YbcI
MSKIKNIIPQHIKVKIWEEIEKGTSYSLIAEKWQTCKSSVSRIKAEFEKAAGKEIIVKPISKNEIKRREGIGKAAATIQIIKKADFISNSFIDAFQLIAYNAEHLAEVIDHSKTEADSLKEKQEEILSNFKEYIDGEPGSVKQSTMKADLIIAIRESIQKMNDFFARDTIRIKAVSEMRKHLETFLKLKAEIMEIEQIKKLLDAFFNAAMELNNEQYVVWRDKVIENAPHTIAWFIDVENRTRQVVEPKRSGTIGG